MGRGCSDYFTLGRCALEWLYLLAVNDGWVVYVGTLWMLVVLAIMAMTNFFRTDMHRDLVTHGGIHVGKLFYSVVVTMFNGLAELSMVVSRLPVFYKQKGLSLLPFMGICSSSMES
ncbi:hypothetical protein JHK85_003075 [Glycine max]|nr:hypothetical protein JHK85_003075 [Glycine max]